MMDTIKKYKTLVWIIVFLLITNFAMLIFFVTLNKPADKRFKEGQESGMYTSLQDDVGFSQAQLDQYKELRNLQRKNVKPLFEKLRKSKQDFYGLLYSENAPDSLVQADADSISKTQKMLDLQMFSHFKSVRNICTPDQLQKFDSTLKKTVVRMTGRPGRGKPSGK